MTGLLLLSVLLVWGAIAFFLASSLTSRIHIIPVRSWALLILFLVLFFLPLADEVIGAWQFHSLCKKYAVQHIDEAHAMNRRVLGERRTQDAFARGTALKIQIDPWVYRDAETGRVVVSYYTLNAEGGWLIRTLGISETRAPLLFSGNCSPPDRYGFREKFNINIIN